jgi:tRNA-binding protein
LSFSSVQQSLSLTLSIQVSPFPEARKPAWKLKVDLGEEIGIKKSSAQITQYTAEELVGTLVMAVVNFKPRQIGKYMSEVLVVGVPDSDDNVVLVRPDKGVPIGGRLY